MHSNAPKSPLCAAVLIRTQGKRPRLLTAALRSVAQQTDRSLAVVIVHAGTTELAQVQEIAAGVTGLDSVVLHADDLSRKRGYPLNVGLRWCLNSEKAFSTLSFLDDDDQIYPFFAREMRQAVITRDADLVYSASLCRLNEALPVPAYGAAPLVHLFRENFIPNNALAIRWSTYVRQPVFFDEEIGYTEDWQFLLRLIEAGYRLEHHPRHLAEFSLTDSDGNTAAKRDPDGWKKSSLTVRGFINRTRFPIGGSLLAGMSFPIEPSIESFDVLHSALRAQRAELERLNAENDHLRARLAALQSANSP